MDWIGLDWGFFELSLGWEGGRVDVDVWMGGWVDGWMYGWSSCSLEQAKY